MLNKEQQIKHWIKGFLLLGILFSVEASAQDHNQRRIAVAKKIPLRVVRDELYDLTDMLYLASLTPAQGGRDSAWHIIGTVSSVGTNGVMLRDSSGWQSWLYTTDSHAEGDFITTYAVRLDKNETHNGHVVQTFDVGRPFQPKLDHFTNVWVVTPDCRKVRAAFPNYGP